MAAMFLIIPSFGPPFLDLVLPLNESRPRKFAQYIEVGIDMDRYFIPIACCLSFVLMMIVNFLVADDAIHLACTTHACCLFQILG